MAYDIYSKAGTDEAISSALADSLPDLTGYVQNTDTRLGDARTPTAHAASHKTAGADALTPADIGAQPAGSYAAASHAHAPADIGAATAAQGALADATTVEQVTLNANLDYTLPAGVPANTIHRVVFTQDGTGGHTVTYGGAAVIVETAAGAQTLVEIWPNSEAVVIGAQVAGSGSLTTEQIIAAVGIVNGTNATYEQVVEWQSAGLIVLSTSGVLVDEVAPTWVANLTAGDITTESVAVTASALATDNVAVTDYEMSLDSGVTWVSTWPTGLVFAVTGLAAETSYAAMFRAVDAAANASIPLEVQFTTASLPELPPEFVTSLASAATGQTLTYTNVSIGAAAADRVVFIYFTGFQDGSAYPSVVSCTIGGVAAAIPVNAGGWVAAGLAYAVVPSGTTADVVITFARAVVSGSALAVVVAYGDVAVSGTPKVMDNSVTVTVPAGGFAILGTAQTSAGSYSLTRTFDQAYGSSRAFRGTLVTTEGAVTLAATSTCHACAFTLN